MHGQLTVELADLRGWAAQVGRAGDDCAHLAGYVTSFVPDGDFGPILHPMRSGYEQLVARVGEVLPVDAERLTEKQRALDLAARRYARTDARAAQEFGVGLGIVDDGHVSPRFHDVSPTAPAPPVCGDEVLPVVTFGWGFDQANDLVISIGGTDLRRELTDLVAGDIGKALAQASVWDNAAQSLAAVRDNLLMGSSLVARSWAGEAASWSRAHTDAWVAALATQSEALAAIAAHLRDAVAQAVDVAQIVVDLIREVVVIAGLAVSSACIPIFGPFQLANKLKDALRLVWEARKVLAVFWTFLVCMKDAFTMAADTLTAASLPPTLCVPAAAA